jgi:hypothetical protein
VPIKHGKRIGPVFVGIDRSKVADVLGRKAEASFRLPSRCHSVGAAMPISSAAAGIAPRSCPGSPWVEVRLEASCLESCDGFDGFDELRSGERFCGHRISLL